MATIDEIKASYYARFEELQREAARAAEDLQREGEELEKDAKTQFKVDLTVRWVDRKVSLHLPQVTMRETKAVFDVPEVAMRLQEMIFHTPSTRMVLKKVGQYPEIHGFKVVWKDILTHVPEVFMQEQRIKMDIPEVRMVRKEIRFHYPDISWGLTEMVLRLPEVEVKDISFVVPIDDDDVQKRSAELRSRGEEIGARTRERAEGLAAAMKADLLAAALAPARDAAETAGQEYATQMSTVNQVVADAVQQFDRVLAEHNLPAEQAAALQAQRAEVVAKGEDAKAALAQVGDLLAVENQELAA